MTATTPPSCGATHPRVIGRCGRDAGHDPESGHRSTGPTFEAIWYEGHPPAELPDPGVTDPGKVACNEPLYSGTGEVVGYCDRLVTENGPGTHRGRHRAKATWRSL